MAFRPFENLRIVDLSTVWAAPYAVQLLAASGADVIKVEHTGRPDFRLFGPFPDGDAGERFWERSGTFNLIHRNKLGITLDLRSRDGRSTFEDLVRISDVVVENYTPRVMKQFGLAYESLRKIRPDLIMLSFTGYGHTGPWSGYPAVGDAMEATCGFCELTGYPGEGPLKAGYAYVDLIATWYCGLLLGAAIEQRARTGQGQWLDVSMYECGVSFLGDAILQHARGEEEPDRIGNDHSFMAPHGCYQAADGGWVALAVRNDAEWRAFVALLSNHELSIDTRFANGPSRWRHRTLLRPIIAGWVSLRAAEDVVRDLRSAGIPASKVNTNKDLLLDPHLATREYFEAVPHPERTGVGARLYPRLPFRFIGRPLAGSTPAPDVGQHNEAIFGDLLGMDHAKVGSLLASGVAGDRPTNVVSPFQGPGLQKLIDAKQIIEIDSRYQERLEEVHPELRRYKPSVFARNRNHANGGG